MARRRHRVGAPGQHQRGLLRRHHRIEGGRHLGARARLDEVALGAAWDEELEPFRHASDDAPVVWLHKVG